MSPTLANPDIIGVNEKFLLYGEPGTGKTFAALTAPGPIYYLCVGAENELKTLYSKQFQSKHGKKETEVWFDVAEETFDTKGNYKGATGHDNVKRLIENAFELDAKGEFEFETLVIDNATVLTEFQTNKALEIADMGAKGESSLDKLRDSGIQVVADHEWKGIRSLMEKMLSELFRTNKHLIVIAHEYENTIPNRATQSKTLLGVKPLFVGQSRDRVANMFDNVWRFYSTGQLFAARTIPQGSPYEIIAKTRVGGIVGADYQDPDLSYTIKKFKEHADKFRK